MLGVCLGLLAATMAADPDTSIWTPSLPLAPPTGGQRRVPNGIPELLYINFDGAVLQSGCGNDAHYDCSTLADLFDGYVGPYQDNDNARMAILQATREAVAEFGIRVVTRRPPDDIDYTMVIYGDLGDQSFAGIAPYIDCEDLHPGDTSFTQAFTGSNTGSTVILQEAAHTWGLEHVDAEEDILNPFKAAGRSQDFIDACFRIVSNTSLQPTPGSCNQIHTQFCAEGWQNSWREMMLLFGPHIPDVNPPEFEITEPPDGSVFVAPVTFALRGEIEDELHPQFYSFQIYLGDQLASEPEPTIRFDQVIQNPPPGEYQLRVVVIDEAGNAAEDMVSFSVLPEGSELPEDEEDAEPAAEGCRTGGPPASLALLLVVGLFGVRRRG
jgi:MYXO-CTERM domain-containing protein